MITAKKIVLSTLVIATCLAGCSKNEKKETTQANIASVAEAQAVPMSAMPADDKATPAIINNETPTVADVDGEPSENSNQPTPQTENPDTAEGNDVNEADNVDNSDMENISEDAEIIDDEPASPNAPKADESTENVNQKVK